MQSQSIDLDPVRLQIEWIDIPGYGVEGTGALSVFVHHKEHAVLVSGVAVFVLCDANGGSIALTR